MATELLPAGRPMLAATVRALPVGLAFVLWSRRLPHGHWWWRSALLGLLNIGAFFALLFVAAFRLPGGVAATAGAIQPLVAASIAAVLLGEAFTRKTALAGMLGIGGVAMLVLGPEARLDPVGIAAALGGTISMAVGVVLTKKWGRPVDLVTFTGWQLLTNPATAAARLHADGHTERPVEITGTQLSDIVAVREAVRALCHHNRSLDLDITAPVALLDVAAQRSKLVVDFAADGRLRPESSGVDGTWCRLRACEGCSWLFYDGSRSRIGQWCSMTICGNRAKSRTHRQRSRMPPAAVAPARQGGHR